MAANPLVKEDPALERFNRMREDAYKTFRWTRKTTTTAIIGCIALPILVYWSASKYQNKFKWTSRRGAPLTV